MRLRVGGAAQRDQTRYREDEQLDEGIVRYLRIDQSIRTVDTTGQRPATLVKEKSPNRVIDAYIRDSNGLRTTVTKRNAWSKARDFESFVSPIESLARGSLEAI